MRSTESRCEAPWIEERSTKAFLFNWGDASGIEVRSTKSRGKAPWIKVHSTEMFKFYWAGPLRREYKRPCTQKSTPLGVLAGVNSL